MYTALRAKRRSMGLTLRAAADKADMGFAYLCDVENGNYGDLRLSTIKNLCKVYEIELTTMVLILDGRM